MTPTSKKYDASELDEPVIRDTRNGNWEWVITKKGGLRVANGNKPSYSKALAAATEALAKLTK